MLASVLGDNVMVMFDQSLLLADVSPVVLAAKNSAGRQSSISAPHAWVVCQLVKLDDQGDGDESLYNPLVEAESYFKERDKKQIDAGSAAVRVIRKPQHGEVRLWTYDDLDTARDFVSKGFGGPNYSPEHGFTGNDSLVLRVEGAGYSVDVHYFLRVIESQATTGDEMFQNPDCQGTTWTIAGIPLQEPNTVGSNTLANYFLNDVSVSMSITNRTDRMLGNTVDSPITSNDNVVEFSFVMMP